QAGAGPHLRLPAQWQFDGDAGGHRQALAGQQFDLFVDGRQQVQPRRTFGGVMRQRQAPRMRQLLDPDFHAAPLSFSAMRAASRAPTSSLVMSGQSSTPVSLTRCTRLRSPPITSPETSLAKIQSAPLRARLAMAFCTTLSVSAAKPITSRGRCACAASVANMSGFSTSLISGTTRSVVFLILLS